MLEYKAGRCYGAYASMSEIVTCIKGSVDIIHSFSHCAAAVCLCLREYCQVEIELGLDRGGIVCTM
jgi:hypothetical protein